MEPEDVPVRVRLGNAGARVHVSHFVSDAWTSRLMLEAFDSRLDEGEKLPEFESYYKERSAWQNRQAAGEFADIEQRQLARFEEHGVWPSADAGPVSVVTRHPQSHSRVILMRS